MRKQYLVIKDTPEVKIGAILEEDCDAGNQGFHLVNDAFRKFPKDPTHNGTYYARQVVMNQPQYFEEVIHVAVPKAKLAAVNKILKAK